MELLEIEGTLRMMFVRFFSSFFGPTSSQRLYFSTTHRVKGFRRSSHTQQLHDDDCRIFQQICPRCFPSSYRSHRFQFVHDCVFYPIPFSKMGEPKTMAEAQLLISRLKTLSKAQTTLLKVSNRSSLYSLRLLPVLLIIIFFSFVNSTQGSFA